VCNFWTLLKNATLMLRDFYKMCLLLYKRGVRLNQEVYEKIRNNPKFHELVTKRSKFAWSLAITILSVYYTFILVIAFIPETLGASIGGGVLSVGIPIGIFIILLCFVLTGIYTNRANNEFDKLTEELKAQARAENE
jgi:uncharacterized membrane protein (DUF485 family)